jgi:hypothetical protein
MTVFREEPQGILGLSWLAIIMTNSARFLVPNLLLNL